jgi:predicted permease
MSSWLESVWQDVRYAFRTFRQSKGFFAVAVASLALGIGANTALFSVVHAVLIDPFPYRDAASILVPRLFDSKGPARFALRYEEWREIRNLPVFNERFTDASENVIVAGDQGAETIRAVFMSAEAFSFLGVPAMLGRTVGPQDLPSGKPAEPVVVLSYEQWLRLFGGDSSALGKTLRINNLPHTVIGVMPPRFTWFGRDSIWVPLADDPKDQRPYRVKLRVRPGVTREQAESTVQEIMERLAHAHPDLYPQGGFRFRLTPFLETTVASGEMRTTLQILLGVVGFVLLIACANVANLQLARASSRSREIAVRQSLGAGRLRLARQFLTESVLVALAGGIAGLFLAFFGIRGIAAIIPDFYVPNEAVISLNRTVLLFALAVSVLTGILFGLAPAWHAAKPKLAETLKAGTAGGGGGQGNFTRQVLVTSEVTLAVVLLFGAVLMITSFVAMLQADTGIDSKNLLFTFIPLSPQKYKTPEQRVAFWRELKTRLSALPGVETVGIGQSTVPNFSMPTRWSLDGRPDVRGERISMHQIDEQYLPAMGVKLIQGRLLSGQDIDTKTHFALISESTARLLPAGDTVLGKRLRLDPMKDQPDPTVEIVGIVRDTRGHTSEPLQPVVYIPYSLQVRPFQMVAVRSHVDPKAMVGPLKKTLASLDPEQPIGPARSREEADEFEFMRPRFTLTLVLLFAGVGLLLAGAGTFSVLSYTVARRGREIGLRMALGASRRNVIQWVIGSGMRPVILGLTLGLVGGWAAARLLQAQIKELVVTGPAPFALAAFVISLVALLACWLPALRAASVDPASALRQE